MKILRSYPESPPRLDPDYHPHHQPGDIIVDGQLYIVIAAIPYDDGRRHFHLMNSRRVFLWNVTDGNYYSKRIYVQGSIVEVDDSIDDEPTPAIVLSSVRMQFAFVGDLEGHRPWDGSKPQHCRMKDVYILLDTGALMMREHVLKDPTG